MSTSKKKGTQHVNTLVITQPTFLPWCGYFDMMAQVDAFIFLDTVQFVHPSWQQRNRIKTKIGEYWLTVPIQHSYGEIIKNIKINYATDWTSNHLRTLHSYYKKAPYFETIFPLLEIEYKKKHTFLAKLNVDLIKTIRTYLGINTSFFLAHELPVAFGKGQEYILNLCTYLQATTFLNGAAGKNLYDKTLFKRHNINLVFHDYAHPVYTQLWGDFISYLSIIDLLFNHGPESLTILTHGNLLKKNPRSDQKVRD